MSPGICAEVNSGLPLPLFWIWLIQGFQTTAASTRPLMKAAAASPADRLTIFTSLGASPLRASAVYRTKCDTLNCSSAIVWPRKSAKDGIFGPTISASLPAELSLTSTAFRGSPLASGPRVSDQVWLLASSCPVDRAAIESL